MKAIRERVGSLTRTKFLYFFMGTVYFAFHKFRKNIMENFGLMNTRNTAISIMLINFIGLVAVYGWTRLSDKFQRHKEIMIATSMMNGLIPVLFLVREYFYTPEGGWENASSSNFGKRKMSEMTSAEVWWTQVFPGALFILHSIFNVPMQPLLDDQALKIIISNGYKKEDYGRQRSFSTMSYLVVTLLGAAGLFREWNYTSGKKIVWPLLFFAFLYAFLIYVFVPSNAEQQAMLGKLEEKEEQERAKNPKEATPEMDRTNKKSIFLNVGFLIFLSAVFLNGIVRGVMSYYHGTYMTKVVGYTSIETVLGDFYGVGMEMILFIYGRVVLQTISLYWLMIFGQIAIAVRTAMYTFTPVENTEDFEGGAKATEKNQGLLWVFYLAEMLKGLSFGLIHLSGVSIAKDSAAKGQEAQAQGLYNGVFANLAGGISAVLFESTTEGSYPDHPNMRFWWVLALAVVTIPYLLIIYRARKKI
ncbi:MAG: permease of the major facilitator superfamily [Amphiamblys sp. WSBS2006]|nr:MAG: permease of the major facilitator superfamily [Amphiamblys sp. WSBS2006]